MVVSASRLRHHRGYRMQYAIEHGMGGATAGVSPRDLAGVNGKPAASHRDATSLRSGGRGRSSARTEAFGTPFEPYGARIGEGYGDGVVMPPRGRRGSPSREALRRTARIPRAGAGVREALAAANDAQLTAGVTNP